MDVLSGYGAPTRAESVPGSRRAPSGCQLEQKRTERLFDLVGAELVARFMARELY